MAGFDQYFEMAIAGRCIVSRMPLPPAERLLPKTGSVDVNHNRTHTRDRRDEEPSPGWWIIVGLFLASLLLWLLTPRTR